MLDFACICNTSHMIWAIITSLALLRGPFPRQKGRYYFRGVAKFEILQLPLPDAFRHQSEVSGASLEKTFEYLESFSDAPKRAPRAVSGLVFQLPTFPAILQMCQNVQEYCIVKKKRPNGRECFVFLDIEM